MTGIRKDWMAICALIMCMSSRSGLACYPAFRHSPPETVHNSHNEPNRTERQSAIPSRLHPRPFWGISLAVNLLVTFLRCDITLIHNPSSLIVPALPILCRLSPHLSPFPPDRTCPAARQFPPQIFDSDRSNPYPFAFVISLSLNCARGYFRRNRRIVLGLRKKNLKRAGPLGVRV